MSRLLALPAELRLMISKFAVKSDGPITIPASGYKTRPALLHVNGQTRLEATKGYYQLNSFRLLCDGEKREGEPKFQALAGKENLKLIKAVTIEFVLSERTARLITFLNTLPDAPPPVWPDYMRTSIIAIWAVGICGLRLIADLIVAGMPRSAFTMKESLSESLPVRQTTLVHSASRMLETTQQQLTGMLKAEDPHRYIDLL